MDARVERKIKILITRSLLPVDQEYITKKLYDLVGDKFDLVSPKEYSEEELCKEAVDADVLLGPFVTTKILDEAQNLKLIQVPWTGVDTFNFEAVKKCRVPICNSHSNATVVAELGMGIILDLLKKISYHDRKMRQGNWNRDQIPLTLTSKMLAQMKICIIGYGSIGRKLGDYLKVFDAKIIAVSSSKKDFGNEIESYSSEDMLRAVSKANMVVLTLPLTEMTKNMVDSQFISNMQTGSYLVTLSRAGIVDEDSVYNALISGKLAGYGSDVWWNTPRRGESESHVSTHNKFEELDQVVFSPHRAGFSENSLPHLDDVVINIANLIEGKNLINQVKISDEY